MNPKPPVHGKSRWFTTRTARFKSLVAVGAITLGFAGAGLAAAGSAAADPAVSYVMVGSDTIQDVMNGFAGAVSDGIIGSYNAVNPVTATAHEIITPAKASSGGNQTNCSFTRPNGSTEGFDTLDFSANGSSTLAQLTATPQQGCIDVSRSSSGPGAVAATGPGSLSTTGQFVYIPFAVDAVTGATGPATAGTTTLNIGGVPTTESVPATNITTADSFTEADLVNLFKNCTNVTEGGITYNPNTAGAGQQQIDLYVPQSGSGTLKFWASTLGFSPTSLPSCLHQSILAGPAINQAVEEHDGTAYASDANGYGPFSIAQWIAQSHGIDDRRHLAALHNISAVSPFSGSALNPNFPILREVYLVTQFDRVVSGDSNFDPTLSGLIAGSSSRLCGSTFTIKTYGFGTLPNANLPDTCGSTAASLRVAG
jgi:hypothetical protein